MQNFIDVVRSRKTADLYGQIEQGHFSSALCHLGEISHAPWRPGTSPKETRDRIKGDAALHAKRTAGWPLTSPRIHRVDLAKDAGPGWAQPLAIDAAAERFYRRERRRSQRPADDGNIAGGRTLRCAQLA